jgi:hypothetical protein
VPFDIEGLLSGAYLFAGQPQRPAEWCRSRVQSGRDTHTLSRIGLVIALVIAQSYEEAITATTGLIEAAEATRNPWVLSFALFAYGFAWRNADTDRALEAMHRGLAIAHESGNRANETNLATMLAELDVERGDPLSALTQISLAIGHYYDSGNTVTLRSPLTNLAIFLDRLGHHEAAATITGFALSPLTTASFPKINTAIAHLREVFGDQTYESLAHKGETMTTAAMATYAYDRIDQARAELKAVSK